MATKSNRIFIVPVENGDLIDFDTIGQVPVTVNLRDEAMIGKVLKFRLKGKKMFARIKIKERLANDPDYMRAVFELIADKEAAFGAAVINRTDPKTKKKMKPLIQAISFVPIKKEEKKK